MNGARFPSLFVVGLGVAVTLLETVSVGAEIYTKAVLHLAGEAAYTTPLALHGLMGTVVGAVYASMRVTKRNGDQNGNG